MLAFLEVVVQCVGLGILCGSVAAILFLRWVDRRMARVKSTPGRCWHRVDNNAARNAREEPATGGAMGYPLQRVGELTLRLVPEGASLRVRSQRGSEPVADLECNDGALAHECFDLLVRQATDEVEPDVCDGDRKVLFDWNDGDRQVALLRNGGVFKVIQTWRRQVIGAAVLRSETQGRELLTVLLKSPAEGVLPRSQARHQVRPIAEEPITGGQWQPSTDIALATEVAPVAEVASETPDPDWDRLFR